jgi:hypothetical protein
VGGGREADDVEVQVVEQRLAPTTWNWTSVSTSPAATP